MVEIVITPLQATDDVEVVERKGIGHPDTICDALAEEFSRNLCREYQSRFGRIMHHNVDKALLCGGSAEPAFGGGRVTVPIRLFLAGRATTKVGNDSIAVNDLAIEGSRAWLKNNLHALDVERDVVIETLVRPGSQDLQALFSSSDGDRTPLANDTSFGVGYAPLSPLEHMVIEIEQRMLGRNRQSDHPAWGEDTKIMAVRHGRQVSITFACAIIGRFVPHIDAYLAETSALARLARNCATERGFSSSEVTINAADNVGRGDIYLTVSGTSAEAGDDGQVGRGNRLNGLITPGRPMSLEAAAGKNPVSHVGKIYNLLANRIAEKIVSQVRDIQAARCLMVSRIGAPVSSPALIEIQIATRDGEPPERHRKAIEELVRNDLRDIPNATADLIQGKVRVF